MPDKTQEARGRRSQARERRRSSVEEPVEKLEQAAGSAGTDESPGANGKVGGTAAKMVGTAVAAGLLGALGGAVKGMLERRASPQDDREPDAKRGPEPDEAAPESPSDEAAPEAEQDDNVGVEPEPQPRRRAPEKDERPASEDRGLSEGDAEAVVSTARRHLEALLGTEVERASGLERADGRWSVYLEVVEVARIPESTDVLATYEVVLGDDGDLAGVSRVRRYRRSQVEEEA